MTEFYTQMVNNLNQKSFLCYNFTINIKGKREKIPKKKSRISTKILYTLIKPATQHTHTQATKQTPVKILFFGLQEVDCVFDRLGHQNTDIKGVLQREI